MTELKNIDWLQIIEKLKKNATSELAKNDLQQIDVLSSPKVDFIKLYNKIPVDIKKEFESEYEELSWQYFLSKELGI